MKQDGNSIFAAFLLILGGAISFYLFWHHLDLVFLGTAETDVCSAVFGKSCDTALNSEFSEQLGIPLAGWGLVYYSMLGTLLMLGHLLGKPFRLPSFALMRGIAIIGALASVSLLVLMMFRPALFCPFCALIHFINLLLVYPVWRLSENGQSSYPDLVKNAVRFIFLGKTDDQSRARWHAVAFILVLFVGLAFYQWSRMQKQAYQHFAATQVAEPSQVLDAFLKRDVHAFTDENYSRIIGDPAGAIQLVVFSDFQCSACRSFHQLESEILQRFGDKLSIRFKHFPLSSGCNPAVSTDFHPSACASAAAAQAAAGQGRFWEYAALLFQIDLQEADKDTYADLAKSLGLNENQFLADMTAASTQQAIAADVEEGERLQIRGTPAVFLNGRQVLDLSSRNLDLLLSFYYFQ